MWAFDWLKVNLEPQLSSHSNSRDKSKFQAKRDVTGGVYLPAGETPKKLYQIIEEHRPKWFEDIPFLQVDEVMTGSKKNIFRLFFKSSLPTYFHNFVPVEIESQQQRFAILGLGLNGHVAFHEPGLEATFEKGEVTLSLATTHNLKLEEGTKGLTYGLGTFLKCEKILAMVTSSGKREILGKALGKSSIDQMKQEWSNRSRLNEVVEIDLKGSVNSKTGLNETADLNVPFSHLVSHRGFELVLTANVLF
jgi:6-phosphogluconolactonase/glucosamine-6-phosphate isomerase/deaminase